MKILKKFLVFILFFANAISYADLKINGFQSQDEIISLLGFDDTDQRASWPFGDDASLEISTLKNRWEEPMIYSYNGGTSFPFLFNGNKYYSIVLGFEKRNSLKLQNNDINFLFMFNPDKSVAQYSSIKINKLNSIKGSAIFFVKAVGLAKEIPDAILLSIDYMDSALLNKNPHGDIPINKITLLFRFSETNEGKLKIKQDDSCLGNPNNLKTIAEARKALKQAKCN